MSYEVPDGDVPAAPEQSEPAPKAEPVPAHQPKPKAEPAGGQLEPGDELLIGRDDAQSAPVQEEKAQDGLEPAGMDDPRAARIREFLTGLMEHLHVQAVPVKVAGKVVKYRKNMTLEPMNAYERHVIHAALQDYPNVTTYSTGVEPNRRTVVAYAPGQK